MRNSTFVIYRLTCEHLVLGAPNSRSLWCALCGDTRNTVGIVIKEWHAYCAKLDCRYGRWTGLSEPLARQLANAHNVKHPGHKAIHKAEIRKDSVRVRDRMGNNGFFAEAEADQETS